MAGFRLQTCCFCINLELGIKIIGYLETIFSALGILAVTLELAGVVKVDDPSQPQMDLKGNIQALLDLIITFVAGVFLLHGAYKRHIMCMKITLGIRYFLLFGIVIAIIASFFGTIQGSLIGGLFVSLIISSYFTLVVYSFKEALVESKVSTTEA